MTLLELFRFLVPYFATVPDEDVEQALELSADARPGCLKETQQDAAQVWFAAWLLFQRERQTAGAADPLPLGVVAEREGDVSRTYGFIAGAEDPYKFWGQYSALARVCTGGITVGNRWRACC